MKKLQKLVQNDDSMYDSVLFNVFTGCAEGHSLEVVSTSTLLDTDHTHHHCHHYNHGNQHHAHWNQDLYQVD